MILRTISMVTVLLATTSLAQAAPFDADVIAKQYQADGYTRIEIKLRQTQAKVEAYDQRGEIEVIYDLKTGEILDREYDDDDDGHHRRAGVFIRNEDHREAFVWARTSRDGRTYWDDDRYDDHDDFDDDHGRRGRHGRDDD